MTVTTTSIRVQHLGDGIVKNFAYDFKIQNSADLVITHDEVVVSADYTVNGVGDPNGGSVDYDDAPADDVVILFERVVRPLTQQSNLGAFGRESMEQIETVLDRQTMAIQEADARPVYEELTGWGGATAVDKTGLPSGISRLDIMLFELVTSGVNDLTVYIGEAAGLVLAGYNSSVMQADGVNILRAGDATRFWLTADVEVATAISGIITLERIALEKWALSGSLMLNSAAKVISSSAGAVAMPTGPLDRIRLATAGFSDTLDSGTISIRYWK